MQFSYVLLSLAVLGYAYSLPRYEKNFSLDKFIPKERRTLSRYSVAAPNKPAKREPQSICYDEYGCYNDSIGDTLPSRPETIAPWYSFNANDKAQVNVTYNASMETLKNNLSHFFDVERPLIIVAHGFGESLQKSWMWTLNEAVLKSYPDAVTMLVDWEHGCFKPLYARAAANVPLTARMTNNLVDKLMDNFVTIRPKNIYFIGFSLGAQFAGYFARRFNETRNERIGRMSILDAAAPLFEALDVVPRKGEADFVEAIHTSSGNSIVTGKFGVVRAFADIDYYPNGGISQPGCTYFHFACAHQRAAEYFTQSLLHVDKCQMRGERCKNVQEALSQKCEGEVDSAYIGIIDYRTVLSPDGEGRIISLKTSSQSPFCTTV